MIEKIFYISNDPDDTNTISLEVFIDKLNELIDAVNKLEEFVLKDIKQEFSDRIDKLK